MASFQSAVQSCVSWCKGGGGGGGASGSSSVMPAEADDEFPAGLKVLVVDDDSICLKILDKMLRRCLYQVTLCSCARDALNRLQEKRGYFDVVLTDVHMPDMDGFELLECIGTEMDVPVIMMSADKRTSVVMEGIKHGASDYLVKPVRDEELKNIWQHVARKKFSEKKEIKVSGGVDDTDRHNRGECEAECDSSVNEGKVKIHKKKSSAKDEEDGDNENDDSASKKPRVIWTVELHKKFVSAVTQLGLDKAMPKRILELMDEPNLSRENVASHLQDMNAPKSREILDQGACSSLGFVGKETRITSGVPGDEFDLQSNLNNRVGNATNLMKLELNVGTVDNTNDAPVDPRLPSIDDSTNASSDQNHGEKPRDCTDSDERISSEIWLYNGGLWRPNADEILDCKINGAGEGGKDVCAVAEMEVLIVPNGFISDSEVKDQLEDRKVFLQDSCNGCPVLIVKASKHYPTKDQLQWKKFVVYLLDKVIASSFRGTEIGNEKLIGIFDLQQISYKNVDARGLITGFQFLQAYYPERLEKLFILNMPRFFVSVWSVVSRFLEKATAEKILIVSNEDQKREFIEEIGEEVLPEEYGGRAKLVAIQDAQLTQVED